MNKNLMNKLRSAHRRKVAETQQPYIRIEAEALDGVPKIYVDGNLIAGALVNATYEWNTNDADGIGNKSLSLEVLDEHARRIEMKMSNVK